MWPVMSCAPVPTEVPAAMMSIRCTRPVMGTTTEAHSSFLSQCGTCGTQDIKIC